MFFMKDFGSDPAPFIILCDVQPNKRNGLSKPISHIVGFARTEDGIRAKIADDMKAMRETYGGLFEAPGTAGRTYRVYRADWQKMTI